MPRAKDLDTIAPDDAITTPPVESTTTILSPTPSVKKKKKIHKPAVVSPPQPKTTDPTTPPPVKDNKSANMKFRQKIYEMIDGKTANSLSAFLARPKVFTFDNREDEEEIILVLRRHWFTNLHWILLCILMLFAPSLLSFIPLLGFFPGRYQFVFILFWYLITLAIAFEHFLSWYFNVFVITEERVIDIDFNNMLSTKFSEAKISMIQDVTSTKGGVSQTIFNYGTILIQTAAEIPVIQIELIPNPSLVIKVLQQMRGEEEQEALEGRIK
jgi:hypothetical protein